MILSDLWPRFQGHDMFRHWIYQKRHEIERAIVTVERQRKSYVLYHMVTFPMTLTDLSPSFQGHGIFEVEYLKKGAS